MLLYIYQSQVDLIFLKNLKLELINLFRSLEEQKCCSAFLAIGESSRVSFEENPTRSCLEKSSKIDPTVCTPSKDGHSEMKVEQVHPAVCTPSRIADHAEQDEEEFKILGQGTKMIRSRPAFCIRFDELSNLHRRYAWQVLLRENRNEINQR